VGGKFAVKDVWSICFSLEKIVAIGLDYCINTKQVRITISLHKETIFTGALLQAIFTNDGHLVRI